MLTVQLSWQVRPLERQAFDYFQVGLLSSGPVFKWAYFQVGLFQVVSHA